MRLSNTSSLAITVIIGVSAICVTVPARRSAAQTSKAAAASEQQHQHEQPSEPGGAQPADHSQMGHDAMRGAREGSGTSWLPDTSPMYAFHRRRGEWEIMAHGNGFLQYLDDAGDRGVDEFGSINWLMEMADRKVGEGHLGLRAMFSFEPGTIGGCGYPNLLASGEQCNAQPIHDRQHQHDLFMELAAVYDRPLRGNLRWHVYGGPAGEPALGPVAYPHRISAMPNLLAPITHHWLDSTHITFGVVTAGISGTRWKVEASAFNGREPDEQRTGFDLAPLDSVSGRLWYLPTNTLALQFSAGSLNEAEPGEGGGPRVDVTRATASATYHRLRGDHISASTVAWGTNAESDQRTHALLLETNVTLRDRDSWFGRFEVVGKTAHDLDVPRSVVHDVEGEPVFTVSKLQGGYARYFSIWRELKAGLGLTGSLGFVPRALEPFYGGGVNPGFGLFLTLRPAAMRMTPSAPAVAPGVPPVHEHPTAKPGALGPTPPTGHEHPAPKPAPRERKPETRPTPTPAPADEGTVPCVIEPRSQ